MITWNGPINNGAFEQLFGLGRGEFSKNFPKLQIPGGLPGGMLKLRIDWYISFRVNKAGTWSAVNERQKFEIKYQGLKYREEERKEERKKNKKMKKKDENREKHCQVTD